VFGGALNGAGHRISAASPIALGGAVTHVELLELLETLPDSKGVSLEK